MSKVGDVANVIFDGVELKYTKKPLTKDEQLITRTIKLSFSSMFKRSMPHLLIGEDSSKWICTNIDPERILVYRPSITDNIHFVQHKPNQLLDIIHKHFPVLGTHTIHLHTSEFMRLFNKIPVTYLSLLIDKHNKVILRATMPNKVQHDHVCGVMVSSAIIEQYNSIRDLLLERSKDGVSMPIDKKDIKPSAVSFVKITSGDAKDDVVGVPVRDGMNCVSLVEYGKKSKVADQLSIVTWKEQEALFSYIQYEDSNIKVMSIRPLVKWFPNRRQ